MLQNLLDNVTYLQFLCTQKFDNFSQIFYTILDYYMQQRIQIVHAKIVKKHQSYCLHGQVKTCLLLKARDRLLRM